MKVITTKLSGFYLMYYSIVGVFMPFWGLYLEHQGFNYSEIGLLASIAIITRFFAPFIWGWLADKSGKRMRWVRIAALMEAIVWLLIFIIPNDLQSIALLMLIFSFFQNAILAQFESVTLFWLGEQRHLYGSVRKWGSIGFIFGVCGVGALFEVISIELLPIILLGLSFLTFLWAFQIAEPYSAPAKQQQLEPLWPILKRPLVATFFAIEFILLFSHAPFYSFYSNFLNQAGFSTTQIGFLWAVGVVAEIIMFAYANYFFKHYSWRTLITACLVLTALRWVLVGVFANSFWMQFLAQTIHAFSFGLFHLIAMRIIFQNFTAAQQGRAQALYSTIWGIAVASGSILAGYYWHIISDKNIFIIAGMTCLLGVVFVKNLPHQRIQLN